MKKLALLFAITMITSVVSFAQLKEGHISYDIEMSSDDPEMAMSVAMFSGSKMDLYFSDKKARTDLEMGSMISMTTLANSETEEVLILMGGMMGNKGVLTNSKEMGTDAEDDTPEPNITITNETKKIAGYKCKKAIITDEDGDEMEYWFTEEIKTVTTDNKSAISKLPGLALQYTVNKNEMLMSFTATKVETKLDAKIRKEKFTMEIPEDYEEMTYEEFSSLGGN